MIFIMLFFFFNDTATTEIYTLSLHDALPILTAQRVSRALQLLLVLLPELIRLRLPFSPPHLSFESIQPLARLPRADRKSTRLNSSHANISYAVFCLKKKKKLKTRLAHYFLII